MRLWYQEGADKWTDALPIGNGRMGAMVYGNVYKDLLCLNEDTLWSGYPQSTQIKGGAATYKKMQKLMSENEYEETELEIEDHFLGKFSESYLPFGNLELEFMNLKDAIIEDYERELSLDTAISAVNFVGNGVKYRREYFASQPDDVIIIHISANKEESIDLSLVLNSQMPYELFTVENALYIKGLAPSHVVPRYKKEINPIIYEEDDAKKGMNFCGLVEVELVQGEMKVQEKGIKILGATNVMIKIYMRTSFNGFDKHPYLDGKDCIQLVFADRKRIEKQTYDSIRSRHVQDYEQYYKRMNFTLHSKVEDKPTNVQLKEFQKTRDNKHLYELLFHYGRYLTIASSRQGTQATNLQGIWNKDLRPAWSSNYTININTQMNYWGTQAINLSTLEEPLFDLIDKLTITGEETANKHYGVGGSVSHHNTDIWGISTPVGGVGWRGIAGTASWNMSYGWLTRHLFSYYEYTLDVKFLRERAYPAIKLAAEYYLDIMVENQEGYLIITPTSSPENQFVHEGKEHSMCNYATMTTAIVREVFSNAVKSCMILNIDCEFRERLEEAMEKLYTYKIGSKGQLLEWDLEYEEKDLQHRHISHLYALYPANQITEEITPELFEACKKTLEIRGDGGTGWSLGWKINFWARLKNGNRALELLKNQLNYVESDETNLIGGGTYANMFDAHPPFQIDGNFGAYAGICEMLVQSYDQTIILLPALSDEIGTGEVSGLRVKNGLEISMSFRKGELEKAVIQSKVNRVVKVQIILKSKVIEYEFLPFDQLVL